MSEEFEQLSRYRAGELTPEAMRALEAAPGFAERLRQLQALDVAVAALPVDLPPANLDALLSKVRRPAAKPRSAGPNFRVGVLAALVVAGLLSWTFFGGAPESWVVVPAGDVAIDGKAVTAPTAPRSGQWSLAVAPGSSAQVVGPDAAVLVAGGAALTHRKGLSLDRGTVLVRAGQASLAAAGSVVQVNGASVISMEPAEGVARVTELLSHTSSGDLMKTQWMKLSTLAVTAAAVGGGLTLFVVDGHASVRTADGPPVVVRAGEQWKPGAAKPSPYRAPEAAPGAAESAAAITGEATRAPASADLKALTAPQLVAMVETLRDEKEALLKQREELKKKAAAEAAPPARNYYRFDPEEALASAKKGELRLRGPQLGRDDIKLDDKLRDELSLTADEAAQVKQIFDASTARTRSALLGLYKEIGGDMNQAATWESTTILSELRLKSLKDEYPDAVRTLANERAGLVPVGDPSVGPPVLRAYRQFVIEDERTISELEKLLGPRRTEELLNHPKYPHSNHTFGVGPAKP